MILALDTEHDPRDRDPERCVECDGALDADGDCVPCVDDATAVSLDTRAELAAECRALLALFRECAGQCIDVGGEDDGTAARDAHALIETAARVLRGEQYREDATTAPRVIGLRKSETTAPTTARKATT